MPSPRPHTFQSDSASTAKPLKVTARRSPKACSCCHVRKIRCDVARVGFPCTKCRIDGFECIAHLRKKRQKKINQSNIGSSVPPDHNQVPASIPEHMMRHKFPYYTFFQGFSPRGQPWLHAKDQHHGVLLPVPMHDQSVFQGTKPHDRPPEDIQFLKTKGALDLPPKEILNEFISHYFRLFHPFFPIIDKPKFLKHLREADDEKIQTGRGPSLLLLQAIIFTSSSTVPIETLFAVGFSTRRQARSAIHTRIRHLYNFNYEPDDISNIQALLLMSHYFPSMVDQKHTWLWVNQAISLAQGAGLHRDSGETTHRKLWARIWWACLVRDRLIALGTGRPMHINSLDCSVPMLSVEDLEEDGDGEDDRQIKAIFVEFTKLCQYMEGILTLPLASKETLPEQLDLCRKTLDHWHSHLGSVAMECVDQDMSNACIGVPALYQGVLHLVYNTLRIALQQPGRILQGGEDVDMRTASAEVQAIAEDSSQLASRLMGFEMSGAYPTICVTSILPPLVIHLQNLRLYPQSENSHLKTNFQACMKFLHKLGDVHWHAGFYHDIFELAASTSPLKAALGVVNAEESARSSGSHQRFNEDDAGGSRSYDGANILHTEANVRVDTSGAPTEHLLTMISSQVPPFAMGVPNALEQWAGNHDALLGEEAILNGDFLDCWFDNYSLFQSMFPSA